MNIKKALVNAAAIALIIYSLVMMIESIVRW